MLPSIVFNQLHGSAIHKDINMISKSVIMTYQVTKWLMSDDVKLIKKLIRKFKNKKINKKKK